MPALAKSTGYLYQSIRPCSEPSIRVFIVFFWEDNGLSRNGIALTGPVTKVDKFAAFRAKWTIGALLAPNDYLFAGRAVYFQYALRHGLSLLLCAFLKPASVKNCWCIFSTASSSSRKVPSLSIIKSAFAWRLARGH